MFKPKLITFLEEVYLHFMTLLGYPSGSERFILLPTLWEGKGNLGFIFVVVMLFCFALRCYDLTFDMNPKI